MQEPSPLPGYLVPDVSFEDMLNYARRLCLDKDIGHGRKGIPV